MPTTAPPILIWQPSGGTPVGPISTAPVYSQADVTQLIEGQEYVDIVFGAIQTDEDWVLVACEVENTTDLEPLNIWPGIITDKTTGGFRLQLNGMPDSENYYLRWAVSGINIAPYPATTYLFTGSTTGVFGLDHTFTVRLSPSTTIPGPITVTPTDAPVGDAIEGLFTPASVVLTETSAVQYFTYSAISYGTKTITVTNSGTLVDPTPIVVDYDIPTYSLSGPSSGDILVPSTDFTVALIGDLGVDVTITPDDGGGGGTFIPTSVILSASVESATFTYTPASTGSRTISTTNDGGLANPTPLSYASGLVDGDRVSTWHDSSGNSHDATQSGSARPTFKTNIVNSKPVVRFSAASLNVLNISAISGNWPWVIFAVMKSLNAGTKIQSLVGNAAGNPAGPANLGNINLLALSDRDGYQTVGPSLTGFHVFSGLAPSSGSKSLFVDGTVQVMTPASAANSGDFATIADSANDGDLAEVIIYNVAVGSTDRANIEKYLGTKYAIAVAGGSAVQPDTVTGLVAWWKSDSLG